MRASAAFAGLFASQLACAAASPAATTAAAPGSLSGQLAQMVFGLLLVVGLIFFLAWLLRRMQGTAVKGGQVIEIVGSRAIGPRDRLLLVQVGKEQILIGHTPGSIEALHVLAEPVEVPATARQATPEFAQRLMELMGKDPKDNK
ncbi:flagellar biosynthetic protein FliO [Pseudomonas sp. P1B16]|jgi:flagellar protein FliO/FliZ|uniref:Flagellar protein n=1 Tax=Pseudomonas capeferrum TaxID=1495066 RepID=A0ABY7R4Z1_9PSED|nr:MULTISPECIES: flagellar biosynthetic protein FliO [Pseudomonas]KGI91557.1 flagellar assembly protein FliO [Pseudomonas sp. H2]MBC3481027.1 flagellar biosynthetic protein FliO [Pseudomonas sp. SWRI77]MBC3501580.1 flagellar biosynthetic protein FliO [Pseudomonas sp. SWRI59]MBC3507866.1 flagellar biosynthetic protein FliO [Pseudomonas sp. SWRI68]MDD2064907.1 flagellar biosynthetic protein FliO [Pseudomonas sp. 25571]